MLGCMNAQGENEGVLRPENLRKHQSLSWQGQGLGRIMEYEFPLDFENFLEKKQHPV